jgi:hypothetical protein
MTVTAEGLIMAKVKELFVVKRKEPDPANSSTQSRRKILQSTSHETTR